MSSFDHALGLWNGVFRSNVLPWFCKAAVHSEHIREASTRRWRKPIFIPTGSPASRSARLTVPSSPATLPMTALTVYVSFGRTLLRTRLGIGHPNRSRNSARGDDIRNFLNQMSASWAMACGAAGFFSARPVTPWLQPGGTLAATSFYDTKDLKHTLERLVDFDRLNAGITRFSAGAVNVRTGNFVYFDSETHIIRPEHVMASGALPPSFPAIEIDGEQYWDGGLMSNTPLEWIIEYGREHDHEQDTLAFQVDLWSSRGQLPRNIADVVTRVKEIQFSSRTRASTDHFKRVQRIRRAIDALLRDLHEDLRENDEVQILKTVASRKVYNIVQLIYRAQNYEGHAKDYEFSRLSMQDHWRAGYHDAVRTLRHPEVLARPRSLDGVLTFDLERDGRE